MLGEIKRTISYKNPEIMARLYKTLVIPHLEYCVSYKRASPPRGLKLDIAHPTTPRIRNCWNLFNIDLPG